MRVPGEARDLVLEISDQSFSGSPPDAHEDRAAGESGFIRRRAVSSRFAADITLTIGAQSQLTT
jgi:hypothetical protein